MHTDIYVNVEFSFTHNYNKVPKVKLLNLTFKMNWLRDKL